MANHVIRDRIWESRKLRTVSREAALAYPWIFLVADDHGRFEYNPRRIWSLVFGNREDVTREEVAGWLEEYWRAGLMKRYHIDGDLAVWEGFVGRKASERRESKIVSPDGMPVFTPNDLAEPRDNARQGAEKRGDPRQIDPRAEIETEQSGAETERSSGDGAKSLSPVPEDLRTEYARAVWEAYITRTQEPTRMMSTVEFEVVKGWMDTGIPLRIVLQAMAETKGTGRVLGYYAASVRIEYERWRLAMSGAA